MDFEGYCVKERMKVQVKNGEVGMTKNGRKIVKGKCPSCGTTVTRFLPSK